MKNIKLLLQQLEILHLPLGQYLIVSSGPMGIRGIRECGDLDILVSRELFDILAKTYNNVVHGELCNIVSVGDIEFLYFDKDDNDEYSTKRQIAEAEIIDGFPFQKLETCLHFKSLSSREKDKADVLLIEAYLKEKNI